LAIWSRITGTKKVLLTDQAFNDYLNTSRPRSDGKSQNGEFVVYTSDDLYNFYSEEKVKALEALGAEKGAVSYDSSTIITDIAFVNLLKKYGGKCVLNNVMKRINTTFTDNVNISGAAFNISDSGFMYNYNASTTATYYTHYAASAEL
jgi:hypothetical protein